MSATHNHAPDPETHYNIDGAALYVGGDPTKERPNEVHGDTIFYDRVEFCGKEGVDFTQAGSVRGLLPSSAAVGRQDGALLFQKTDGTLAPVPNPGEGFLPRMIRDPDTGAMNPRWVPMPEGVPDTSVLACKHGSQEVPRCSSIPITGWTTTPTDDMSFVYRTGNCFDDATGEFVAPADGKYRFIGRVGVKSQSATGARTVMFQIDGKPASEEPQLGPRTIAYPICHSLEFSPQLKKGQRVSFAFYHDSLLPVTILGGKLSQFSATRFW